MTTTRLASTETQLPSRAWGTGGMGRVRTVPGICLLMLVRPCFGQDIEPRRWSHLPIGIQSLGAAYAETSGEIFLDPVLRIEDAEFDLSTTAVKYIWAFELAGKSARVDLLQAWQSGNWEGLLDSVPTSAERDGWSDTTVRLAVNLLGAPPLTGKEFAAYRAQARRETIVGAGLAVQLPTGDYLDEKLINLGSNRYTFTPQLGLVRNIGRWSAELTGSLSFYTENDSFFNGRRREEDPFLFLQGHIIYNFRPGLWLAASAGYGYGGESTIDGVPARDRKEFTGWGLSLGVPLNRRAGIKFGYIGTATRTDTGSDTGTVTVACSFQW